MTEDANTLLDRAERLLCERGDAPGALAAVKAAFASGLPDEEVARAYYVAGQCRMTTDDLAGALAEFRGGLEYAPEDPILSAKCGEVLFDVGESTEAEAMLERAIARFKREHEGSTWHAMALSLRAICLDRRGARELALESFRAAHALAPEAYRVPVRMGTARFAGLAREAIEELPDLIKQRLGPLSVRVEEYWPEGRAPARAVFIGRSIAKGGEALPNEIVLYQRAIENHVSDLPALEADIRKAVFHEVGHYLGFEESGLAELGLT